MYGSGFRCYVGGMFTNRPQHLTTSQQPTFKLPAFQEDKRLAFVDSVCATLMTSRFGWGAMYTLNPRFRGTADEPFDYLSLLEEEPTGWHEAPAFLGRTILGRAIAGDSLQRRSTGRVLPGQNPAGSKGIASPDTTRGRNPTTLSPANLGRGSPNISGT